MSWKRLLDPKFGELMMRLRPVTMRLRPVTMEPGSGHDAVASGHDEAASGYDEVRSGHAAFPTAAPAASLRLHCGFTAERLGRQKKIAHI